MDKEQKENKEMPEDPVEEKPMGEGEIQEKAKEAVEESKEEPKMEDTKVAEKKEEKPKKEDVDDDFKYIVRISNTDIDGDKKLLYGLTSIKGIGIHISSLIIDTTGFDPNKKVGKLSDSEIEKIQKTVDNVTDFAPVWMLNHRKDYETGEDIHIIGPDIDLKLRDEINILKKIRCYRGIRHESGLPVRGQRTRGNNRRGLALGVSKKRP